MINPLLTQCGLTNALSSSSGVSTLKSGRSGSYTSKSALNRQNSAQYPVEKVETGPGGFGFNPGSSVSCAEKCGCVSVGGSGCNGKFLKSMLFDTYLEFGEFTQLFKSFYIHMRKVSLKALKLR